MKLIKKVAVTPVTPNTGDIIDSFSTSDDKHTNAPSINAVETELNKKVSKTNDNQTTLTFAQYGTAKVVRRGNVVSIYAKMELPAGEGASTNDATLPEWAFPSASLLDTNNINSPVGTDMNLYSASRLRIVINNNVGKLTFVGNNMNNLNAVNCYGFLTYIVD